MRIFTTKLLILAITFSSGNFAFAEPDLVARPHLFITANNITGLRSVEDLRNEIRVPGPTADLWGKLITRVERDIDAIAVTPANFQNPERPASQSATANPDYTVCHEAGQRIVRNALACLITGDTKYRDAAMRQIESLFDKNQWPDWRDRAHREYPADLRNGMLGRDIAIAYDWMHRFLSTEQRHAIVSGLDRRAIQPFWKSVDANTRWVNGHNNWTTCIVGGLGIVGMALAEDHPDSQRLVDFSLPRMRSYLKQYGRAGEFNESVGYSTATRLPAMYFSALRYSTHIKVNNLGEWPFVDTAIWNAYTSLPPGRLMAFGDAGVDRPVDMAYFATIAAASRNQLIQWFYTNSRNAKEQTLDDLPLWLLGYDWTLDPQVPTGKLPLGRAFHEHGAILVSRTSWDPRSTPCVVYGKAGIERNHEHHDAGQLCIDGYGKRLIVDMGSPSGYPADFFGPNRWSYYNASWIGHNVVTVDGAEMDGPRGASAHIVASEFDDKRGGYWQLDLTAMVPFAKHAIRTVVHLTPGVVAVVDDVQLNEGKRMSLRWHTIDKAVPDSDGMFEIVTEHVNLSARVLSLTDEELNLSRGEHRYVSPFDTDRTGAKLEQRQESFILVKPNGSAARILSLFVVLPPGAPKTKWQHSPSGHRVATPDGTFLVNVRDNHLKVLSEVDDRNWRISLDSVKP
jgi:hypothetical protein